MPKIPFKISSIFGGWSVTDYFNLPGQFLHSLAIDPDMPANDDGNKPSGYIRPTVMTKFSGAEVDAVPLFIVTQPKTAVTYIVLSNGKILSYNANLSYVATVATI